MACIREMGAPLIYKGANLCILHQGISKYKKLRMQIFGEWLSICSNFPNYYIFTKYFGTFIHCCTTFKDQFTRVLVNKFTSQCPALLWSWYKKGQAREIQLHISSQSWRPPILGYDGAKKDFDSAVICMTFLESLSNMVAMMTHPQRNYFLKVTEGRKNIWSVFVFIFILVFVFVFIFVFGLFSKSWLDGCRWVSLDRLASQPPSPPTRENDDAKKIQGEYNLDNVLISLSIRFCAIFFLNQLKDTRGVQPG